MRMPSVYLRKKESASRLHRMGKCRAKSAIICGQPREFSIFKMLKAH